MDFSELTTTNFNHYPSTTATTTTKTDPAPVIFFQPTATAKLNFLNNRLFVTLQVGRCISNHGAIDGNNRPVVTYFPITASTGIGFRLEV